MHAQHEQKRTKSERRKEHKKKKVSSEERTPKPVAETTNPIQQLRHSAIDGSHAGRAVNFQNINTFISPLVRARSFYHRHSTFEFLPGLGVCQTQERLSEELICGLTQLLPRVTAYLLPDVNRTIFLLARS